MKAVFFKNLENILLNYDRYENKFKKIDIKLGS
jgi:hypothetical protein